MNLLFISNYIPMPDRSSGDLRFRTLLDEIATAHQVNLCVYQSRLQEKEIGAVELDRYKQSASKQGIRLIDGAISHALRKEKYDAIWFEFYYPAVANIHEARFWQPQARTIVDSVDVHFHRLSAKARLTNRMEDAAEATRVKTAELGTYRAADVIIAVTEEDANILKHEDASLRTAIIPNIHIIPTAQVQTAPRRNTLIFIGSFGHDPNVDAMLYFGHEVLPLIATAIPDVRLLVVGSSPPESVQALASEQIQILGFVPDITPVLLDSHVSVAPLRFGGGMKGKIGEALSYALPVVTTQTGIEGFGLNPGQDVLVGDTPKDFARQVIALLRDDVLYERIRWSGFEFVRQRYSREAVSVRVHRFFSTLQDVPIKRMSPLARFQKQTQHFYQQHIAWRLRGGS